MQVETRSNRLLRAPRAQHRYWTWHAYPYDSVQRGYVIYWTAICECGCPFFSSRFKHVSYSAADFWMIYGCPRERIS